jgi:hypothetical protein
MTIRETFGKCIEKMLQLISVFINGISSSRNWQCLTHHKTTPSTFRYHFSAAQNILFGTLAVHYGFQRLCCMMFYTGD